MADPVIMNVREFIRSDYEVIVPDKARLVMIKSVKPFLQLKYCLILIFLRSVRRIYLVAWNLEVDPARLRSSLFLLWEYRARFLDCWRGFCAAV